MPLYVLVCFLFATSGITRILKKLDSSFTRTLDISQKNKFKYIF